MSDDYLTYEISIMDGFKIYQENEAFRNTLNTGNFTFVPSTDQHGPDVPNYVLINHPMYVGADSSGLCVPTEYAKAHLNECALQFTICRTTEKLEESV